MEKLIIEINEKNWNFLNSLEEVRVQIESWFFNWFNSNEKWDYNYYIK